MKPGIDPKVDYAFKRVFGSEETKDVLIALLDAILTPPPGHEVASVELLNPFNDKETPDDKNTVLDVKVRDATGRLFNVEMQMVAPLDYPRRALYYWAKLYTGQLKESEDFDELRATISISFLANKRFDDRVYHHRFRLRDDCGERVLTEDLQIHFVELPKFDLRPDALTTAMEVWCYFLKHGDELDSESLPAALDVPPVRRALEVLNVMSLNDRERELYENRIKARRDRNSELKGARKEGRLIERVMMCQELLGLPVSSEDELAEMTPEKLTELAEGLKKRLPAPK